MTDIKRACFLWAVAFLIIWGSVTGQAWSWFAAVAVTVAGVLLEARGHGWLPRRKGRG